MASASITLPSTCIQPPSAPSNQNENQVQPPATTSNNSTADSTATETRSLSDSMNQSSSETSDDQLSGSECVDKLNRKHYKTPHTGPAFLCVRAAKFYSSTSQSHANDLLPILKAVTLEGHTAIILIVDCGPDWSTASLLNSLSFYCLRSGMQVLTCLLSVHMLHDIRLTIRQSIYGHH